MRKFAGVVAGVVSVAFMASCSSSSSSGASAGASTSPTVSGSTSPAALRVTSTLDGKTVLPHRIAWLVKADTTTVGVAQVNYLIDGHKRWQERQPPFFYGEYGGFLVTSWLRPGQHTFDAVVKYVDGRTATDSVTATVLAPPKVPAALAGTWRRSVANTSKAPKAGGTFNPNSTLTPPGTYEITFDSRWIKDTFPCTSSPCRFNTKTGAGNIFYTDWTPGAHTLHAAGAVTFRKFSDTSRVGDWWCNNNGPAATYRWSVSGNTLTLAPNGGHDICGIRGFIWAGQWKRA